MTRITYILLYLLLSFQFTWAEFNGLGSALNSSSAYNFSSNISLNKVFGSAPDTLEIYAFKVQFKYEEDDNSLTTGRGHFDSDLDTAGTNYSLDPLGQRASSRYWEKHFEFVSNYFKKVSNNNLVIEAEIYPKNRDAYQLDKEMIDYNRTQKKSDEKVAEFNQSRAEDYLNFIRDAVLKANASDDSPFKSSKNTSPNRHRVYMIIHAGASRLVDGGSLGQSGADTPGDFIDIFITQDAFSYLENDGETKADASGIILNEAGLDTLKEIMVVSETASQDGLNWGINGIMVNQIARQIGMPSTYDIVKGISRLGDFDVMDFAGYNAQKGFLPVMPSAWIRAYMGWANVKEVRPGPDGKISEDVFAVGANQGTEVLKVPLAGSEYLLIENRQRTTDNLNEIKVSLDDGDVTVPSDSLSLLFLDSICTSGRCEVNKKKARGVVLDISSYDAGLPASGIAVWHVNEWYIRQYLKYGFVNAWAGDTLKDHQFGIALVEADGALTIGKEFKNSLGQPAFDYGSGADLLPHISQKPVDPKSDKFIQDTVLSISPIGYGNTGTTNDGRTHIDISVKLPSDKNQFHAEKYMASYSGDTVTTFQSKSFKVEISWGDLALANSKWPLRIAPKNHAWGLDFIDFPIQASTFVDESAIMIASGNGYLQLLDARGDSILSNWDSLFYDARYDSVYSLITTPSSGDSMSFYPIYNVYTNEPTYSNTVAIDSGMFLLNQSALTWVEIASDGSVYDSKFNFANKVDALAGPMLYNSSKANPTDKKLVIAIDNSLWTIDVGNDISQSSNWNTYTLTNVAGDLKPNNIAVCGDQDGDGLNDVIIIYDYNNLALYSSKKDELISLETNLDSLPNQNWNVVCSDFNRDNQTDVFILGSLGYGAFIKGSIVEIADDLKVTKTIVYSQFKQYLKQADSKDKVHDFTGLAIGDINDDGYPEVIFAGRDLLWAVENKSFTGGVPLDGFPFMYNSKLPQGYLMSYSTPGAIRSAPLVADVNGDGVQDIISATPAGLIYAVNGEAKLLKKIKNANDNDYSGALRSDFSDWPLAVNEYPYLDSTRSPYTDIYLQNTAGASDLELYGLTDDYLYAWSLPLSLAKSYDWLKPGGSYRQNYLDASLLKTPTISPDKAVISEFYLYPNPLRKDFINQVKLRFDIGADAAKATVKVIDIAGSVVKTLKYQNLARGKHIIEGLNFSNLGSDVYAISLEVKFASGEKKIKWDRFAVIK